jgi:hypothetical protein
MKELKRKKNVLLLWFIWFVAFSLVRFVAVLYILVAGNHPAWRSALAVIRGQLS